ncbi:MAG: helix-turn-helix transcriptional regulator [Acidimicrobiales bacterium]
MVDRLERLTDLVLVLLGSTRPKTLREIAEEVPGYPPEGEARRQAFERDKRTLRDGGIAIATAPVDSPDQIGYVIRPDDFYLPELNLDADEQAALNLAVAGVHLGDPSGRDALWRLGLPGPLHPRPVAGLPALPGLPALWEALRMRAVVRFGYRGATRTVSPAQLRFHNGYWYLVGLDVDKQAARTFRVDRMDDMPVVGDKDSAELPGDFDAGAALADEPWQTGDGESLSVDVLVDLVMAGLVTQQVRSAAAASHRDDGALVLRLDVTNVDALRSWVLEMGEHAEILGPPEVRDAMVEWLQSMVARSAAS